MGVVNADGLLDRDHGVLGSGVSVEGLGKDGREEMKVGKSSNGGSVPNPLCQSLVTMDVSKVHRFSGLQGPVYLLSSDSEPTKK
jgi:hypothetical protein